MANIKISELTELSQVANNDLLAIVDTSANETKKIEIDKFKDITKGQYLLAVSDTAPTECQAGDKYYNTTNEKIYKATGVNTWNTVGTDAELGIFYIVLNTQNIYVYNGTELVSVGGGAGGGDSTPIGVVEAYAGSTAPIGYLLCDGSAVSRTTYSSLFSVIGTTYGSGDGSTTFNLPNIKGKVIVMQDTSQTEFDTLGETGGEKTHILTINEMPSHSHKAQHLGLETGSEVGWIGSEGTCSPYQTGLTVGDQPHNNLQPYIVLNYIIKVQKLAGEVLSEELPIGTEIDFNGQASDIPIGWEQVGGKSLIAYELYNNASGTIGNITLSDSAANYDCLEIYYRCTEYCGSDKFYQPNGKNIRLSKVDSGSDTTTLRVFNTKYSISGNSINVVENNYTYVINGGTVATLKDTNYIYIDRVVGYKEA